MHLTKTKKKQIGIHMKTKTIKRKNKNMREKIVTNNNTSFIYLKIVLHNLQCFSDNFFVLMA